jgi:hypothetical protein
MKHKIGDRFVPDGWYISVVSAIRVCLPKLRLDVHVISEGNSVQFSAFISHLNATLHLDDPPYVALELLVHADVLVMGSSSFSYLAAVLHDGRAVITNGDHYATAHGHKWRSQSWIVAPSKKPSKVSLAVDCKHLKSMIGRGSERREMKQR